MAHGGTATANAVKNMLGIAPAGTEELYKYDKPVLELDGENNENARNVYGTSLVSRNSLNYLYNGHGDTTAVINGNTVVTEYEYDAFGNGTNFADDDSNPFRYCGEYYDTETKLIYLKARYYNPALGRFTAEDTYWNLSNMIYGDNTVEKKDESAEEDFFFEKPVHNPEPDFASVLQSGNLYLYCCDNPIKYVDPSGLYDKALLESLRGYIFGYDNRHTDYHDKANAVRDELKVNAQYLEGWNEGSELDGLIAKITCDDAYTEGSSISDVNRAIELTDEYWKDYNRKNTIENVAFTAGIATVILPATKAAVGSAAVSASGGLNFAKKAAQHMSGRFVPIQILQEAIRSGTPSPDPRGSNATMYTIEMIRNGKEYILEVLYDKTTNTIYHFLYK